MVADAKAVAEVAAGASPVGSGSLEDYAIAGVACTCEALAVAVVARLGFHVAMLVVVHAIVVGLIGFRLLQRVGKAGDLTGPLMVAIATLVSGPLGAFGALLALPLINRPVRDSRLLADWYARISSSTQIDPAAQLANTVAAGRTIDAQRPAPPSFERIMRQGSLHERQTALGLIARKFHPDYAAALMAALKSPEPVVRVQAAAVAAKLRGELKRRLAAAVARLETKGDASALRTCVEEFGRLVESGLVDAGEVRRAKLLLEASGGEEHIEHAAVETDGSMRGEETDARRREAGLIAAGRFAELRLLRRSRRLSQAGLFRLTVQARRGSPETTI